MTRNSINQASLATDQNTRTGRTINATPTGAVDTAVLRFDVLTGSTAGIVVATTADNGTILTINQAGVYQIDLGLDFNGAVLLSAGIGINMGAGAIIADPLIGTDGVVKATDADGVAANTAHLELSTVVYVTGAQAAAGLTVRFLATDSAAGAPAGLVAAFGGWRVHQIAQVSF